MVSDFPRGSVCVPVASWPYLVLAALLLLAGVLTARPAQADGVTTCTRASAVGTNVLNCLSNLVYQPLPVASATLVLVCPQGHAGLQDQSVCPGNVWRPLSAVQPTDLVGYCAQAQLTPYQACDFPNGKEGYRLDSDIFGSSASTSPPPTTPPPTTPPPTTPPPPTGSVTGPAQLSWSVPATGIDGNPVSITGYTIRYGTTDFSQSVSLPATTTTYTLQSLASGTWRFEIIAQDSSGNSAPSNPVSLTIAGSQVCGAAPATATQTIACPRGTTGTWTQSHGWSPVAYPACWAAKAWTPTSPPAGSCSWRRRT